MASRIRNFVFAALLGAASASTAAAQTGAVLTGVVYDRAGDPVPGVVVTIVDPMEVRARVAVTDQHGVYFVDRLDYGTSYAVKVSHPRFRTSRVQASANEGESPVHITLDPRRTRLARLARFSLRVLRLGFNSVTAPL